jgi:hypothetical protein
MESVKESVGRSVKKRVNIVVLPTSTSEEKFLMLHALSSAFG